MNCYCKNYYCTKCYAVQENKMACSEKPRVKVMQSVRKDYGDREKDKKSISILLSPSSEKGISFLQYDYEDVERDSDQWIYLSALKKVKRIVTAGDNEPKKGSFFGSEFSYEDMEQRQLDDYTYKLVGSEQYNQRECSVVESTPKPKKAKRSSYSKSISWIDKERNMAIKSIFFDRKGKEFKEITVSKVEKIDGIWVPMVTHMNNMQTKRISTLTLEKVVLNREVEDSFLSQRSLTDSLFRESRLKAYQDGINN
jgi:hypothetical protein